MLLELTQQIAQQQIAQQLEQLVKDRQTTNIASDTSLNLEFDSNRNPEVKSSVQYTSIPAHKRRISYVPNKISDGRDHKRSCCLTLPSVGYCSTSTGYYSFGFSISSVLWFRG